MAGRSSSRNSGSRATTRCSCAACQRAALAPPGSQPLILADASQDSGPMGSSGHDGRLPIRDGVIEKLRALYDGTAVEGATVSSTSEGGKRDAVSGESRLVLQAEANIGNMRGNESCMNAVVRKTSRLNEFARRLQRRSRCLWRRRKITIVRAWGQAFGTHCSRIRTSC